MGYLTIAKDQELGAVASGNLAQQRQQVVRNTLGVLSHDTGGVGTSRVEVSEVGTVPLLKRLAGLLGVLSLGVDEVLDDVLNEALCAAVGVCGSDRAVLGDGNHVGESGGIAVDGGGRGEDNVGDIVLLHGAEERDGTGNIDAVVLEGNLSRLTHSLNESRLLAQLSLGDTDRGRGILQKTHLESSKVNDTVDLGVRSKDLVELLVVGDVGLVELGPLAADELNAVQGDLGRVVETVYNDDLVAILQQGKRCEGANVASATVES